MLYNNAEKAAPARRMEMSDEGSAFDTRLYEQAEERIATLERELAAAIRAMKREGPV
jgi:hypothetical protein